MRNSITTLLVFFLVLTAFAQKGGNNMGFQVKPFLPSSLIGQGYEELILDTSSYSLQLNGGISFGFMARHNITNTIALESGIRYTKRNYTSTISKTDPSFTSEMPFSIVSYEIPINALFYVQTGSQSYINAALGVCIEFFPSDVSSFNEEHGTVQESARNSWIQAGTNANLGWEYRSKESGTFYFGLSYHLPYTDIYLNKLGMNGQVQVEQTLPITGTYLSLDLRYYIHRVEEDE